MARIAGDPNFMESLARGLDVLRCFGAAQQPLTVAQASRMTGLSRPAVARCLHTLQVLGYVSREGQEYGLRPKVLALGHSYLASSPLSVRAEQPLEKLRDEVQESCSIGILDDGEVCYVARAPGRRIMSIGLQVGSRLPLYCTSMGRVLLAALDPPARDDYLRHARIERHTARTETDPVRLLALLEDVRVQGYAVVDEELELGLRSIAVPVRCRGKVIAALNMGVQAARISVPDLRVRYTPILLRTAREIEALMF